VRQLCPLVGRETVEEGRGGGAALDRHGLEEGLTGARGTDPGGPPIGRIGRPLHLSGDEKQRLAIARLLLKQPAVVVLDEATAHLDSGSEAAVQRALATALEGRTSLVIAHRLATIRNADEIVVLVGGAVAERGTHDELCAAGGLYRELCRTQFATTDATEAPLDPAA
jgi:ABC-type transport system involved in cytochrome bd biosynthesis fused ATPase/permease subunit